MIEITNFPVSVIPARSTLEGIESTYGPLDETCRWVGKDIIIVCRQPGLTHSPCSQVD